MQHGGGCGTRVPWGPCREGDRHTAIPSGALRQSPLLGHMFSVNIVEL